MTRHAAGVLAAFVVALLCLAATADARPGGGQGYSGSSGGRSGGSSGGGGGSSGGSSSTTKSSSSSGAASSHQVGSGSENPTLFFIVFFGIILVCGVPIVMSIVGDREDRGASAEFAARRTAYETRERNTDYVAMLREHDPDFSVALFEDLTRALFSRAHQARHDLGALGRLAPYLSAKARNHLRWRPPVATPVTAVVLGAMRLGKWNLNEMRGQFVVEVEFEANLMADGVTQLVTETWSLARKMHARTRPWQE